jgi:electron transfer flavoprotein alpha subunit
MRDITFEMLTKGRALAGEIGGELEALIMGFELGEHVEKLSLYADRVIKIERKELEHFNAEAYQRVLSDYLTSFKPLITLIGHTSFGVDLAPALAAELGIPLATDCLDIELGEDGFLVTRQMYEGKINVLASLRKSSCHIATIRPSTFEPLEPGEKRGEVEAIDLLEEVTFEGKRFIEYYEPPLEGVDISQAEILVSVGRGIKDEKNLAMVEELAETLKAEVGCSRPIVDKGWLPKDRQVGSSGKTVKPKFYLAMGISGSFQHVMGMKNSDLILAINKDSKAPIFRVSDYGVVDDLFKIVPVLTQKIRETRQPSN